MTDRPLVLLSPYRPPTSYPVALDPAEAAGWLNGWAALWHPAALAGAAGPPVAASAYDHDQPAAGAVYALAAGPTLYLPDDWEHRLKEAGAVSFQATADRCETLANLRAAVSGDAPPEAVRLFAGVGYGFLMLDTYFDALGHDKLLDVPAFWADVTAAVAACQSGDLDGVRTHLGHAAVKLQTAREQANGSTFYLLDWLTLDATDLGRPWPATVTAGLPASLIAPSELLDRLADEQPQRFAELAANGRVEACGGAVRERDDALLPIESQLWNLTNSRTAITKRLGTEPTVFARRKSASHPQTPSWLTQAGFRHMIAVSMDGALVPTRYTAFVNWSGPDGKAIDAFSKEPLPADAPATFFNLAYHLHQAGQHDSSPAVPLLHKGEPAGGYADLVALTELAPVFGRFASLAGYFGETHPGDYAGAASADEFFADYLDDRVSARKRPDPVSGFARHLRLRKRLDSALALSALYRTLTPDDADVVARLDDLEREVELRGADIGPADAGDELADKAAAAESDAATRLTARLQARAADDQPGVMVLNPCGFARRVTVELDDQPGPVPIDGPVKACEFDNGRLRLVVEVPGLGFAWVPRGTPGQVLKPRLKTAEATTVRNEFLEADVDPATGGLRAVRDVRTRLNRLGQMLVYNPGSKMVADKVGVSHAGAAVGEVTSEGRVTDEHDRTWATFRQRVRAWVGRPVLELRIEITPEHKPAGYPWHAYYGSRFVWRDERAAVFRGVNGANAASTYPRPVSPDYLELRLGRERTFVFTGGLPFVQTTGKRTADVVLIPEGETATAFDLLLAADREHPMQTAAGWTAPAPVVPTTKGPPAVGTSGWLAAVDLPSLLLLGLRPTGPGRAVAARFVETAGFGGTAELRFARDPNKATAVDLTGQTLSELTLFGDAIPLEFSAGELIGVRAEWA